MTDTLLRLPATQTAVIGRTLAEWLGRQVILPSVKTFYCYQVKDLLAEKGLLGRRDYERLGADSIAAIQSTANGALKPKGLRMRLTQGRAIEVTRLSI